MSRFIAVLAGTFIVGSSLADIAGLVPHSEEMPSLASRVTSNVWPIFLGLALMAPQRHFLTAPRFFALLLAHLVLVAVVFHRVGEGLLSLEGFGWLDFALLAVAAIPVLSTISLWARRRSGTPPNNSFKPKPLRGSA
ncbi:hypothetical protein [Aerolutibacter daejeonensis]|uniref:hypothetical protein n=1 Tax=Aerolutibacter daejeonensis TaxID=346181 RepID=UPI0012EC21B0|nr:hypothetical protein [Lysobacter daejeonensis]